MEENELHKWMIEAFGPFQGEMAWQEFQKLPESIREQMLSQDGAALPQPSEVQSLMEAFTAGNLNTMSDVNQALAEGPINLKLAQSLASKKAREGEELTTVNAQVGNSVRSAASQANLWLDAVTDFNPAPGSVQVLTRDEWVDEALPSWIAFASPVAQSMNTALADVFSERLGGALDGEIAGVYAGPVSLPLPDDLKNPNKLIQILGNTSYAMQLGHAAGNLSHEIRGGFDQSIALIANKAGALVPENIQNYAKDLDIDYQEVLNYLALVEVAHARLFASVPWLMPRFEALIGKYSRGVEIDLDAMEQQLRDATQMNPESIASAVNLSNVAMNDTPDQRAALHSIENLLALVEGWVDCVVWRAGMAQIPHIEQLREMHRRERAIGGAAELTFESLLGMKLRPKMMREAAELWETITFAEGIEGRDSRWSHPDKLPVMPENAVLISPTDSEIDNFDASLFEEKTSSKDSNETTEAVESSSTASSISATTPVSDPSSISSTDNEVGNESDDASNNDVAASQSDSADYKSADYQDVTSLSASSIDWDSELSQLLDSENLAKGNSENIGNSATPDSTESSENTENLNDSDNHSASDDIDDNEDKHKDNS